MLVPRVACAVLTAILALILYHRASSVRSRVVLLGLVLLAGVANILVNTPQRAAHSNQSHYYIGAKYALPYFDSYRIVAAARGEPQVNLRDLRNTDRMVRADPREQRLYYADLLTESGVAFSPRAGTAALRGLCITNRLFEAEAGRILDATVGARRAAALKDDLTRAKYDTDDQGFNGSPFYVLVRRLDPSIHMPFGPLVFWVNLAWQWAALALVCLLCARSLGWRADEALFVAALFIASWDYAGWSLNGLITGGWLLPVAVAVWGLYRRNPLIAGTGIAWAGLMKLFPFAMLLPLAAVAAKDLLVGDEKNGASEPGRAEEGRPWIPAVQTIAVCAVATLALGWVSSFTGASWSEFLRKIGSQFAGAGHSGNGVGVSHILFSLRISGKAAMVLSQLVAFFCLTWLFWVRRRQEAWNALPFGGMVLLACMVFLSGKWLNYYAIISLCLVPTLARRHPQATVLMLVLAALGFALPEFGHVYAGPAVVLAALKIAAYHALPVTALVSELGIALRCAAPVSSRDLPGRRVFRHGKAIAAVGVAVVVAVVCRDGYVSRSHRIELVRGEAALSSGNANLALAHLERAARLAPSDTRALAALAVATERLNRAGEAKELYRRVIALDPRHGDAVMNLGVLHMEAGETVDGVLQLERAAALMPHDPRALFNLAQARMQTGDLDEAERSLKRALLIDPDFRVAAELLAKVEGKRSAASSGR